MFLSHCPVSILRWNTTNIWPFNLYDVQFRFYEIRFSFSSQEIRDWKYVAMVMDRLFLFIFSTACFTGTLSIFLYAPSLYDHRKPLVFDDSQVDNCSYGRWSLSLQWKFFNRVQSSLKRKSRDNKYHVPSTRNCIEACYCLLHCKAMNILHTSIYWDSTSIPSLHSCCDKTKLAQYTPCR